MKQELQDPAHNTHLRQANYSEQKAAGMKALLFLLFIFINDHPGIMLNLSTLKQKHLPDLWWIRPVDPLACMNFHEGSVSHKLAVTKPIAIVRSSKILAV